MNVRTTLTPTASPILREFDTGVLTVYMVMKLWIANELMKFTKQLMSFLQGCHD